MSTTDQLTIPATCPAWCGRKGQDHDYDEGHPEDTGYHHDVTVDAWATGHPDADPDMIEDVQVGVRGFRHDDAARPCHDWPDEVWANGTHPGFIGGVGLDAANARRLARALIAAADLIDGAESCAHPLDQLLPHTSGTVYCLTCEAALPDAAPDLDAPGAATREVAWVAREARALRGSDDEQRRARYVARKAALLAYIERTTGGKAS